MEDSMTFHLAKTSLSFVTSRQVYPVEGIPTLKRRCLVYCLLLSAGSPWSKCSGSKLTYSEWFLRGTFLEEL